MRGTSIRFDGAVLFVCFVLYWVSKTQIVSGMSDLIRWYFTDLLAVPSLLALFNLIWSALARRPVSGFAEIAYIALVCSIIWEVIAPLIVESSIGDPFDVLAYFIGALGYYALRRVLVNPRYEEEKRLCR